MQWYYSIDSQRSGPVPHAELERLIQAGTVKGDTLVWRQGMDQWKSLGEVQARDPAIFATPAQLPPTLPPQMPSSGAARERLEAGGWAHSTENVNRVPQSERRPMRLEAEDGKPVAPEVLLYAGFWRRAGAFCVDFVIWFVVWNILSKLVEVWFFPEWKAIAESIQAAGGGMRYEPTPEEAVIVFKFAGAAMLTGLVWAVVYDLIFITRFAATPGKLLLGLRLVKANNKPLGFARIVARCLAKLVSGLPTFFIGFLIVAFDDQHRGLHDFFCGTRVVKKRNPAE